MNIEQIYTGCLAQGAYYITSNGEAAIIDPLREIQPYLNRIERDGVKLKYIFETHFHADFVSGHVDLSKATGAAIIYGPEASCDFHCVSAADEQVFKIGDIKIQVLHTPGHTMESSCFLLIDPADKMQAIFTGDTLFINDVGRPDLAQNVTGLTQEKLAAKLYHSLRNKIMTLPDNVVVYPAHGAGSACGKNMSKETISTIGNQKKSNYALREDMSEADFIHEVTAGLLPPPAYFMANVKMNKSGYKEFELVKENAMKAHTPDIFEALVESHQALLLDTRNQSDFAQSHIPQSINIGLNGDFAPWVGALIVDVQQPLLLIADEQQVEEVITRLSRVGFDHVLGYLKGGMSAWQNAGKETDSILRVSAKEFEKIFDPEKDQVIDVRKESEYAAEHLEDAYNRPLAFINEWIKEIPLKKHFYLHCAGGYRSMMAASILQARGFRNFSEIEGGFEAIKNTSLAKTDVVCSSKTLNL